MDRQQDSIAKPCPFCNSHANIIWSEHLPNYTLNYFVECENCGARGPSQEVNFSIPIEINIKRQCIEKWNTRIEKALDPKT